MLHRPAAAAAQSQAVQPSERLCLATLVRQPRPATRSATPNLGGWLKIEPQVLRFGDAVRKSVQDQKQRWSEGVGFQERESFEAFLALPAAQRKIVREVILAFSKASQLDVQNGKN